MVSVPTLPDTPSLSVEERIRFPDLQFCNKEGLLCLGGNLSTGFLLSAYEQGIFPWYGDNSPIMWWSPDLRCIFEFSNFYISKSRLRILRKTSYRIVMDTQFSQVMHCCATVNRAGRTWIVADMISAYTQLHRLGFAHSVEVWGAGNLRKDRLVGGLYGISIGKIFSAESMFSLENNASTLALAALIVFLRQHKAWFLDAQVANPHTLSLGGKCIPRSEYINLLAKSEEGDQLSGWKNFSESTYSVLAQIIPKLP